MVLRTRKQVRHAIDTYWDGRDEMNLAEFPVALLSQRAPQGIYTLKFQDEIHDRVKKRKVQRRVTVAGSPSMVSRQPKTKKCC